MKLQIDDARDLLGSALTAHGYTAQDATAITDHLIDCELRGLASGGLARAISVIERVQLSGVYTAPIGLTHETAFSAQYDGGDNVGYLVANKVTDTALAKASAHGIAVVGANQTWYTGMFSYYLERITAAGYVGMVAGSGAHLVAPHGSSEARFATNPIAFGFPTAEEQPVIWDIGTSSIILADVLLAHRLGHDLPEGIAYDPAGQPTRTPLDVLGGALTVWGGHKGSGLALVVQMLGMLAGASSAPEGLRDCGFLMVVIDPAALGGGADFAQRATEYADSVRAARPLDPASPVRMPFDRSSATRAQSLDAGSVEVADEVVSGLRAAAANRTDPHHPHLIRSNQ